jgi:hypothetical protein
MSAKKDLRQLYTLYPGHSTYTRRGQLGLAAFDFGMGTPLRRLRLGHLGDRGQLAEGVECLHCCGLLTADVSFH